MWPAFVSNWSHVSTWKWRLPSFLHCSRESQNVLVLCTFKENFSSVCRLFREFRTAFLSNTKNGNGWQVARIENIKCNSGSKSLDPVSTVLLWHLIFAFHGGKHISFHHHYHPFCQGAVSRTSRFTWEAMAFSKISPWFGLETSPSLPGFQASFSISAMWGMILSSCCARGRKVSSRGNLWKLQIQKWSEIVLNHKTFRAQICLDGMDNEWTHTKIGSLKSHDQFARLGWHVQFILDSTKCSSTKLPMVLHWRHNSEVTNFEIWKSGKDQVLKSWDIWCFQIHPNSDSVHPILRNNKLPSCQVPNYQRVGPQFQQMLLISHQGQKPKSSDLAAQRFQIGIHGMQTCKLATLLCDIAALPWSPSSPFVSRPWDMGKSMVIFKKNGSTAFKEIQGHGTQHEGQHCFHTLDAKICILRKANLTDQSSWLVFDRAIS